MPDGEGEADDGGERALEDVWTAGGVLGGDVIDTDRNLDRMPRIMVDVSGGISVVGMDF